VIAVRNAAVEELSHGAALIVGEDGLADAMLQLDRDDGLRARLRSAGLERAKDFSWQRSAEAHLQAYTLAAR
jgi:glycosyltransferase involved in cell wall biosynthesis